MMLLEEAADTPAHKLASLNSSQAHMEGEVNSANGEDVPGQS